MLSNGEAWEIARSVFGGEAWRLNRLTPRQRVQLPKIVRSAVGGLSPQRRAQWKQRPGCPRSAVDDLAGQITVREALERAFPRELKPRRSLSGSR